MRRLIRLLPAFALTIAGAPALAQEAGPADAETLAKAVANPISSLISVPFQNNLDCCYGTAKAAFYTLNIQPVVPLSISSDWNLIIRTILPLTSRPSTGPGVPGDFGFSDVTQTFFFSPSAPVAGLIVGAGPALVYPIGSEVLGSRKWSAGPSIVVLRQHGQVTAGVLANQLWSYAGQSSRPAVSAMFLQPFFNYTLRNTTSFTLSSESSYDWTRRTWTVPVIFTVGKLFRFGTQAVQLQGGAKVYATTPAGGPEWGLRASASLLFPKR